MKTVESITANGSILFREWFNKLNPQAAAKMAVALVRLEQGNTSNTQWFSGLGEYKIDWGPGYRIYLLQDGNDLIVLLGGGIKKQQERDIKRAKELLQEYRRRR